MTAERDTDGTAAADVLIRRLEFPLLSVTLDPTADLVECRLGQPETTERDLQPLRAGQRVSLYFGPGGLRSTTHGGTLRFSQGTIERVGEQTVWLCAFALDRGMNWVSRLQGASLVRVEQRVAR